MTAIKRYHEFKNGVEENEHGTDIDITPLYTAPPAASVNSPVIPDGWKLAPAEPAAEMIRVGGIAFDDCEQRGEYRDDAARRIFMDMMAAAPAPGGDGE